MTFDLMNETDKLIAGEVKPTWFKPSHDTIEFNTLSIVDTHSGKRRYFRLWGHTRNRVIECNHLGAPVGSPHSPIGYLKDATGVAINRKNKWLVDIEFKRADGFVSMLGVGETRMEAVLDYVSWYVTSFEAMKRDCAASRVAAE